MRKTSPNARNEYEFNKDAVGRLACKKHNRPAVFAVRRQSYGRNSISNSLIHFRNYIPKMYRLHNRDTDRRLLPYGSCWLMLSADLEQNEKSAERIPLLQAIIIELSYDIILPNHIVFWENDDAAGSGNIRFVAGRKPDAE